MEIGFCYLGLEVSFVRSIKPYLVLVLKLTLHQRWFISVADQRSRSWQRICAMAKPTVEVILHGPPCWREGLQSRGLGIWRSSQLGSSKTRWPPFQLARGWEYMMGCHTSIVLKMVGSLLPLLKGGSAQKSKTRLRLPSCRIQPPFNNRFSFNTIRTDQNGAICSKDVTWLGRAS